MSRLTEKQKARVSAALDSLRNTLTNSPASGWAFAVTTRRIGQLLQDQSDHAMSNDMKAVFNNMVDAVENLASEYEGDAEADCKELVRDIVGAVQKLELEVEEDIDEGETAMKEAAEEESAKTKKLEPAVERKGIKK